MLLDANAMDMKHDKLSRIMNYLRSVFPRYRIKDARILHWDEHEDCFFTEKLEDKTVPVEVSSFIHTETILKKGLDYYLNLKSQGLSMLWWGIESGCTDLMRAVRKFSDSDNKNGNYMQRIQEAGQILNAAGIFYIVMIIVGLGGERFFESHLEQTCLLLNKLQPPGIAFSDIIIDWNSPYARQIEMGEFDILSTRRIKIQRELFESVEIETFHFDYNLEDLSEFDIMEARN